jgi:tRNA dimethylallyltransferase
MIQKAHEADIIPIITGGTGLYFHTLTQGLAVIPSIDPPIREDIRNTALEQGTAFIYALLKQEDPLMAEKLHPTDTQRLSRALEVIRSTGESLHHWQNRTLPPLISPENLFCFVLETDRTWLVQRIHERFDAMIKQGALEEIKALMTLKEDLPSFEQSPVWKAVGVPPLVDYVKEKISLETATQQAKIHSCQYAKRQVTWFRNRFKDWKKLDASCPDSALRSVLSLLKH